MAIIEVRGGPITHRYLVGKLKDELARLYMQLLRDTEQDAREAERYRWLRDTASRAQAEMFLDRRGTRLAADRLCDAGIDIAGR